MYITSSLLCPLTIVGILMFMCYTVVNMGRTYYILLIEATNTYICIQWNPSKVDTMGTWAFFHYSEVSITQGGKCTCA